MTEAGYRVMCQSPGCTSEAVYKVAAEWSDSTFNEMKTYALSCEAHLEELYRDARRRCGNYVLAEGESLSAPGVFELRPGDRAPELSRRRELEERFDANTTAD